MANNFYSHSGYPVARSAGASLPMRNELQAIAQAFDKFPPFAGAPGKFLRLNAAGTALEWGSSSDEYVPITGGSFTGTVYFNSLTGAALRAFGTAQVVGSDIHTATFSHTDAYNSGRAGGGIVFSGKFKSDGSTTNFGGIRVIKENLTDGSMLSEMVFTTNSGTQTYDMVRIRSDGVLVVRNGQTNGGYAAIVPNATANTGHVGFFSGSGVRQGYIGGSSSVSATPDVGAVPVGCGALDVLGFVRCGTAPAVLPAGISGAAVDIGIYSGTSDGFISAYNRSASESRPLTINGSSITLNINGTAKLSWFASANTFASEVGMWSGIQGPGGWRGGANGTSPTAAYIIYNYNNTGVYLTYGSTAWAANSDIRLKENLEPIAGAVARVAKLRSVVGNYKSTPDRRSPFLIAQDVQEVLPEAVTEHEGFLGVEYTAVIPLLVAAINELSGRLAALEARAS